jgi:DNA-directed RNA polymerase III subunit RPC1
MGKILTIPELVYSKNIEKMRKCILNGPKTYPGAVYLVQEDGSRKDLSYGNRRLFAKNLKIGDKVGRHLINDDIVLFNR